MSQVKSGFVVTVSCHKREVLTVGGKWFVAEDVSTTDGVRKVLVLTKRGDHQFWLRPHYFKANERVELFPGVFITFIDVAKRSKLKLRIEADKGVPISRGYPRHQVEERFFVPISQIPALSHLAG